jgi:hypothetical protein
MERGAVADTTAPDLEERSAVSLEQFGYRQELKRSLSLFDLVVYGLVYINFVAPLTTFGIVFNASRGMVPLVYIVGAIATTFTALSYVYMSRAFPVAGSVYSYAGRGIGESAGFIAGWMILLDYFVLPAVGYVVTAVAIESIVPDLPRAVWIVLFLVFNTTVNLLGIEVTAKWNKVICTIMFATVGLFIVVALVGLANGVGGARLSTTPFSNPPEFSFGVIFGALSVAIAAFLGFDAVSTLAEETRGGPRMVGRATLLALAVGERFHDRRIVSRVALRSRPRQLSPWTSDRWRNLRHRSFDWRLDVPISDGAGKGDCQRDRGVLGRAGALTGFLMLHISVIVYFVVRKRVRIGCGISSCRSSALLL